MQEEDSFLDESKEGWGEENKFSREKSATWRMWGVEGSEVWGVRSLSLVLKKGRQLRGTEMREGENHNRNWNMPDYVCAYMLGMEAGEPRMNPRASQALKPRKHSTTEQ